MADRKAEQERMDDGFIDSTKSLWDTGFLPRVCRDRYAVSPAPVSADQHTNAVRY